MSFIRHWDGLKDRSVKLPDGDKIIIDGNRREILIYVTSSTKVSSFIKMSAYDVAGGKIWKVTDISTGNGIEILLWDLCLELVYKLGDMGIAVEKRMIDQNAYYVDYRNILYYMKRGDVHYVDNGIFYCYKQAAQVTDRCIKLKILETRVLNKI